MKTRVFFAFAFIFLVCNVGSAGSYAIVVSDSTQADAGWSNVVAALSNKYENASVITWSDDVDEALPSLTRIHPRFTCFVATPTEASRQFVADVHRMTRRFDGDPYADTLWGILTGFDAANTLAIAKHRAPLTVENVASGTEIALEMCAEGIWYDELVKYKTVRKQREGGIQETRGPADTTRALAKTLTDGGAELFVTSGHATERNWQIGYRYQNGYFRSAAGRMFGITSGGERFGI